MAAQVQITNVNGIGSSIYVTFNVVLTGSYVAGGDPLNFTSGGTLPATADPTFIGLLAGVEGTSLLNVDVWSQGGNIVNQLVAIVTKSGTPTTINPATGAKLKIGAASGFGTEFSAGAYSAGLLADIITGMAVFTKMI